MATALVLMLNITYASVANKELELASRHSLFRASVIARDILANTGDFTQDWGIRADALVAPFIREEQVRVLIFNDVDRVLVDTGAKLRGMTLEFDLLRESRQSREARFAQYRLTDGTEALYTLHPILRDGQYKGAVLRIEESDPQMNLSLGSLVQDLALYGFGMIAVAVYVGTILVRRYLSPLDDLQAGMGAMTRGNFDYKVPAQSPSDFTEMSKTFNLMSGRLAEVEQQQREFVASVSHEIKTPIAALRIITEALLDAKETVDRETIFDFLKDVGSESERLQEIVDDLLYLVKLEKKDLRIDPDVRPISRCLEDAMHLMEPLANQAGITLHREFTEKVFAEFDYNRMKQVFINLIGNAIKYNSPGGNVRLKMREEKNHLLIEIQDDGWGIPQEDIPYLFDRFYRVDKGRSRQTGGTGLGLAIAKEIVVLHLGDIAVTSEVGEGSLFQITLPKKLEVGL